MHMKILTILGTRPEIIRLSRVMAALDRHTDHQIVHTGQNYDYELNEVFFKDLEIRKPDHFLGVDVSSLGATLGGILSESEKVLVAEKPDAVLILGDTNSALAAIMAKRMKIPVFHMEAGNRSYDQNVPEELNRRIVDHTSDFNLVYTEHARRHLLSEGLPHRRIYLTGSPMGEVLDHYRPGIESSNILETLDLKERGYFIVSIHREENVDNPEALRRLLDSLNGLAGEFDQPVIVSTHPRTRKRLEALEHSIDSRVQFLKPFGFFDYNQLQLKSFCAISDSGTISEESALLGFPAITVRNSIERPEALDTGSIVIAGLTHEVIVDAVRLVTEEFEAGHFPPIPADYQIRNTSQRVVRLILGLAGLSNRWWGVDPDLERARKA